RDVDVERRDCNAVVVAGNDAGARVPRAPGYVRRVPRLVLELTGRPDIEDVDTVDEERIVVELDGGVLVDDPLDGCDAPGACAAVAGDERIEERSVWTGAHGRVGGELQALDRRCRCVALGDVERTARDQRRAPRDAAVGGLDQRDPGIAAFVAGKGNRGIDEAIVVSAGEQVPRVDRRYRDRRLVLLGEEGIAGGPLRAGDHIDVGSGDGRRR